MTNMEDARNIQVERFLDFLGLEWELLTIPLNRIDRESSLNNQARIISVQEHLVSRYADAMESGAVFPASICGVNNDSRSLITADGNHRNLASERIGREYIHAYVFKYETYDQFELVAHMANTILNGAEATLDERLLHASYYVDKYDQPMEDAARSFGITRRQLETFKSAQKARLKFNELGISIRSYEGLSDTFLARVHGGFADDAIRTALRMAKDGIYQKDILDAGRKGNVGAYTENKRSEQQLQNLSELEKLHKNPVKKLIVKSKRDVVYMRLKAAIQLLEQLKDDTSQRDKYKNEISTIHRLSR